MRGFKSFFYFIFVLAFLATVPNFAEATDVYSGSFTWNGMLRIRMGWGFGSIWTEGPYSASGNFSYTDGAHPQVTMTSSNLGGWEAFIGSGTWVLDASGRVTSGPNAGSRFEVIRGPDGKITRVSGFMYYYGNWDFIIWSIGDPWIGTPQATPPQNDPVLPYRWSGGGGGGGAKDPIDDDPPREPEDCPLPQGQLATKLPGNPGVMSVSDPVNIVSGNFFLSETDLRIKSRLSLNLIRNYNSLVKSVTAFGRGWSTPFTAGLVINESNVVFRNSDGSALVFEKDGENYITPEGHDVNLSYTTDTNLWCVSVPRGSEWYFNEDVKENSAQVYSTTYLLQSAR